MRDRDGSNEEAHFSSLCCTEDDRSKSPTPASRECSSPSRGTRLLSVVPRSLSSQPQPVYHGRRLSAQTNRVEQNHAAVRLVQVFRPQEKDVSVTSATSTGVEHRLSRRRLIASVRRKFSRESKLFQKIGSKWPQDYTTTTSRPAAVIRDKSTALNDSEAMILNQDDYDSDARLLFDPTANTAAKDSALESSDSWCAQCHREHI